ncbi:MAG: hypothetical protein JXR03_21200 [Cyclobacteriaceae bacterium]
MVKRLILIISIFFIAFIQNASSLKSFDKRFFDTEKMQAYHELSEFDYTQEYVQNGSFLNAFITWLMMKFSELFSIKLSPQHGWNWIRLLAVIVLIVAIILVVRLRFGKLISSEKRIDQQGFIDVSEVSQTNYHRLFQEAMEANDLKLCARYLYNLSIQSLSNQGKIQLSIWKTAKDYLDEVPESDRTSFGVITGFFEATWFGDKSPETSEFESIYTLAKQHDLA